MEQDNKNSMHNKHNAHMDQGKHRMNIKMKFAHNEDAKEDNIIPTLMIRVITLLEAWKINGKIKGVYNHVQDLHETDVDDVDIWLSNLRLIVRKKVIHIEMLLLLHTRCATMQLCQA